MLSLDATSPLLPAMGLPSAQLDDLREVVRDFILALRQSVAESGVVPDDLGRPFLATISDRLGEDAARALERWADRLYHQVHADLPQWSGWRLAFSLEKDRLLDAVPRGKRATASRLYEGVMDHGELDGVVEGLRKEPLSDWDLEMFARHGLDPDGQIDPFAQALRLVAMHRFQDFARELARRLSDEELDAVRQRAEASLRQRGIWMPGPLAPLQTLPRAAA